MMLAVRQLFFKLQIIKKTAAGAVNIYSHRSDEQDMSAE